MSGLVASALLDETIGQLRLSRGPGHIQGGAGDPIGFLEATGLGVGCGEHLEGALSEAVAQISKRVTEAYAVLRDPRRRQAYDRMIDEGRGLRQRRRLRAEQERGTHLRMGGQRANVH